MTATIRQQVRQQISFRKSTKRYPIRTSALNFIDDLYGDYDLTNEQFYAMQNIVNRKATMSDLAIFCAFLQ